MPKFVTNSGDIIVSGEFICNIMPDLNGAFVKVYLYIRYLAAMGLEVENSGIAEKIGLLESEVVHALGVLEDCGLIRIDGDTVSVDVRSDNVSENVEKTKVSEVYEQGIDKSLEKEQYKVTDISRELELNKGLSDMLKVAQEVLGKPLNSQDVNTLFWFFDGLDFSPEVILMLLEYCVSADKRSMAYAEKVAIGWHERGVKNIDDVEKLIDEEHENESFSYNLKRVFGINDRKLTKMEENFILDWKNNDKMDEEMIALAYEYSILQINKLSFPYMNKIIKRWKNDGIFTVEAAEADNERHKNRTASSSERQAKDSGEYDYNAIEKRMWDNI